MFDIGIALGKGMTVGLGILSVAGFIVQPEVARRYADLHFIPRCEAGLEARLSELRIRAEERQARRERANALESETDEKPGVNESGLPGPQGYALSELQRTARHLPDWARGNVQKFLHHLQVMGALERAALEQRERTEQMAADNLVRLEALRDEIGPPTLATINASSVCACAVTSVFAAQQWPMTAHVASVRLYTPLFLETMDRHVAGNIEACRNV